MLSNFSEDDSGNLIAAPSLDRVFSLPTMDPLEPQTEFTLNPAEVKVVVMGKEGFSASPVSITNFLKEAGFQGNLRQ